MNEHLSSVKIAGVLLLSDFLQIVEFYFIHNQDIDFQSQSKFPGRFVPFFIFNSPEQDPFTWAMMNINRHQRTTPPIANPFLQKLFISWL